MQAFRHYGIKTNEIIPIIFSRSPNSKAEMIVDTTIPTALQVAYAAPKLMEFRALENKKKQRKYATKHPIVGYNFVNPAEYLSNVVAISSSMIAHPNSI